jgi:hypothetical protein
MRALEIVQKVDRRAQAIARGAGEWAPNVITEVKASFGPPLTIEETEFLDQYVIWRRSNPISVTPVKA